MAQGWFPSYFQFGILPSYNNEIADTEQVIIVNEHSPWSCGHHCHTHVYIRIYTHAIILYMWWYNIIELYSVVEERVCIQLYVCMYTTQYNVSKMTMYTLHPVWANTYITSVTKHIQSTCTILFCLHLLWLVLFYFSYALSCAVDSATYVESC